MKPNKKKGEQKKKKKEEMMWCQNYTKNVSWRLYAYRNSPLVISGCYPYFFGLLFNGT